MAYRKKLIEVALPLEAINEASAREKSIRHGHPSTLHLWWARRPLAAARAVIFSSLVDDPDSADALPAFVEACRKLPKGKNADLNDTPRMRLFDFIERLVQWESTTDEAILNTARELINIATEGNPPPLLDPFAGGGSIPLEAQRLGLEAHASDLNPVAVMINKAQIEIPPRFANRPPVNPRDRQRMNSSEGWKGAAGLAADVRYYGEWMRDKAWERIGHLYPKHNGETVIAWIWARTVKSPNPAIDVQVPLVRSFELSKKKGKRAWIEPIVDPQTKQVSFVVCREQDGDDPKTIQEGTVNRRGGRCIVTGVPIPFDYIRAEGKAGRIGAVMMAIVTEGAGKRNYYAPASEQIEIANVPVPPSVPNTDLPEQALGFRVQIYGMTKHRDLFTSRQLIALMTFSELVSEVREQAHRDAIAFGLPDDSVPLSEQGVGARAYAEAIAVYSLFTVDRLLLRLNSISGWDNSADLVRTIFARQTVSMSWDFAESNVFSNSTGAFADSPVWISEVLGSTKNGIFSNTLHNNSDQQDAATLFQRDRRIISTDPPYYDNIGYADLSDFFYVWMRPVLRNIYPELFGTMLVPKERELIAAPYRFGGSKEAANKHFEDGMVKAFSSMRRFSSEAYPLTVYYAFKQSEGEDADEETEERIEHIVSTGWETMLQGIIQSGFSVDGTWPMRTELPNRMRASGSNALASSIVLVCRSRSDDAPTVSRNRFIDLLRKELPAALKEMQSGNIAPVDLAQASIGPGMAIYSRYKAVLEPDGKPLAVRAALGLINQELDTYLAEQDGDIDGDTRFAIAWFDQFGFTEGEFGSADVLARAKNTSVRGIEEAGVVKSGRGKVKLVHWSEYDPGAYDPLSDKRATIWEATHHLIERLNSHGEEGAALLMNKMQPEIMGEARNLAYRLYSICERRGWADHARDYNTLVIQWPSIAERAAEIRKDAEENRATQQQKLFED